MRSINQTCKILKDNFDMWDTYYPSQIFGKQTLTAVHCNPLSVKATN